MARPNTPLEESPANDILSELQAYALKAQTIPCPHAFYQKVMIPKDYHISRSCFDYWWFRMQIAGWITVDPETRAVSINNIELRRKA